MKKLKLKLMLITLVALIGFNFSTPVLGANENIQILQKAEKEYIIYISGYLDNSFEFAFSNDKEVNKEELKYKVAAADTAQKDKNYIAYIDESLYTKYFNQPAYLWARTLNGEYFIEGVEINLLDSIKEEVVELANNITKIIKVDTKNTTTTIEMQEDVKVTKTAGKVDILEEGETYYQLVELPSSNEKYNEFMKVAEQIANSKVANNMYSKLQVTKTFAKLYKELVPEITDSNWLKVENNVVEQPEDSKNGEQYILWLKTENKGATKLDAQFLTCFEDYKPEVISEKIVTKLPVTYDNPILFIILAILIIALIVVVFLRIRAKRKETDG